MTAAATAPVLMRTTITSLPLVARGKVRDIYAVGEDRLLMIATDRISAFDVVMNEGIPGKGQVLTKMALFWFDRLADIVPNHLTGVDPESVVAPNERDQVRGRSMVVKRLTPVPIEAVVRGYLAGSAWNEYQRTGAVCGVPLPPGLKQSSRLPQPIFTPATKAEAGAHDENIDFARATLLIGQPLGLQIHETSVNLYLSAAEYVRDRRIILADTKFEFGLDANQTLTLMDEILTPDSSRYWFEDLYCEGISPVSCDKQPIRDWLCRATIDGIEWRRQSPPPRLPYGIIKQTSVNYSRALVRITES